MTANRKLTIGIIALLIINIIILGVLLSGQKHRKDSKNSRQMGPERVLVKKLDFNKEQIASFKVLIKEHRKEIRANDEKIRSIKTQIFNSLGDEAAFNIDSLSTIIGGLQKEIEVKHYNHFVKVKALCNADQLIKFDSLSKQLSKIFSSKGRGPKRKK